MKKFVALCISLSPLLSAEVPPITTKIGHIISPTGVTYVNKAAMEEGLARGAYDDRNPFVQNVGVMMLLSEHGEYKASTITRIAPDIYLMSRHAFARYQAARSEHQYAKQYILQFGDTQLSSLKMMYVMPLDDDEKFDAIVVKMLFNKLKGSPLNNDFLPMVQDNLTGSSTAFTVSVAEVFHATSAQPKRAPGAIVQRALSVQNVDFNDCFIKSSVEGRVPEEDTIDMSTSILCAELAKQQSIREPAEKEIERLASKGLFFSSAGHRLAATLFLGASGTPLIVKVNGSFFIAGILMSCASLLAYDEGFTLSKDAVIPLRFEHRFVNLFPQIDKIEDAVRRLLTDPAYR